MAKNYSLVVLEFVGILRNTETGHLYFSITQSTVRHTTITQPTKEEAATY